MHACMDRIESVTSSVVRGTHSSRLVSCLHGRVYGRVAYACSQDTRTRCSAHCNAYTRTIRYHGMDWRTTSATYVRYN